MISLHEVSGVDQAANFFRVIKKGGQLLPVVLLGSDRGHVLPAPFFFQRKRVGFRIFPGGGLVNGFEIVGERFAVFPDHIFQTGPDLMDHAALRLGLEENGMDGIGKSGKPIYRGDEKTFPAPSSAGR